MEVIFTNESNSKAWDDFALASDDAWFWHTTHWMDYNRVYFKDKWRANSSFMIVENSNIVAICPVIIEGGGLVQGSKQFSLAGGPIPFPAMQNDLSLQTRQKALKLFIQTLASIAHREDVNYVSVKVPSLAKSYITCDMPFSNPLLKFGFIDLAYLTQLIDLRKDLEDLWADVRKGHRSDIKRAAQVCEPKIWDQYSITVGKFSEYQALHSKDAGRVTRSQETFDLMYSWIQQGYAILVEAEYKGKPIGFSLTIIFGKGAYYGSSCKDPDNFDIPASHLIQWSTICWLKENQFEWYDIGLQQFHPQWFDPASTKDISISLFKRGFGGSTIPLVTGEYFYSKNILEMVIEKRWQRYMKAISNHQVNHNE